MSLSTVCRVFSAVEMQESRSSIVATKVENSPSKLSCVAIAFPVLKVLRVMPSGVFRLSGETAVATASAVFAFWYRIVILASNVLSLQLLAN